MNCLRCSLALFFSGVLLGAGPVFEIGTEKQLFLDHRFLETAENVTIAFHQPELPRENLLPKDKPWEQHLMGIYSSVLEDETGYKLYYESYADKSLSARYINLATSKDGVHWTKPELGIIDFQGSRANNILAVGMLGSVFLDPHDTPARRYKMITRGGVYEAFWPVLQGSDGNHLYLFHSPDGIHWSRDPAPVLPFYVGAPTSVFWDESIRRWAIYPRGYSRNPGGIRLYTRLTMPAGDLSKPYPYQPMPDRKPLPNGGYNSLRDEIPPVIQPDELDPVGTQVYTLNASRYADSAYVAFPSVWYSRLKWYGDQIDPAASDTLEVQFAFSRDGIRWHRPWRRAVVPTGQPGSGAEGQIYASGLLRRDDQLWLYYATYPVRHLTGDLSKPLANFTARAIWRLDGFASADAPYSGGSFTTPLLRFTGARLELNARTGGGGYVRVELLDEQGNVLAESSRFTGNSVRHPVAWNGGAGLAAFAGRPVRLRFRMRDASLWAFQFRP